MSAAAITLNARFKVHRPTGMQRYAIELAARFGDRLRHVEPGPWAKGLKGHLWEQSYLPIATRGSLLWSPVSTGPVTVERQVCTIHDVSALDHPEWYSKRFAQWYNWVIPRLARRSRHIIAVSSFTKHRILERFHIPPESVSVVLNGVNASYYPRSAAEIAEARRNLGITSEQYVLFIGSVEPRKNLKRLMEAWASIRKSIPEGIQLVIAGLKNTAIFSGVELSGDADDVLFTGYVSEKHLPALYSGATAFVYPALYEGFGLPPLEAMACGTPVVTSGTTSIPEVTDSAAVLVDPLSVSEIAEGLRRVIIDTELRDRLREQGLARATALTWDRSARETWEVLEREAGR